MNKKSRSRIAGRYQPLDWARDNKSGIDFALRDNFVDLGIGLAKHFYCCACSLVGALGSLLIRNRLLVVFLGGRALFIKVSLPFESSSLVSSSTPAAAIRVELGLYQVWTVDGKKSVVFLDFISGT